MAEEEEDTVDRLLGLLHAKYVKQASSTLVHEEPEVEQLCRRLAIREVASASPSEQETARSNSNEDGNRNDEDTEMPQSQEAEAPKDKSQKCLTSKDAISPVPSEQELSGPDGKGDRNDEELPKSHESKAPTDESQKLNALKHGTTNRIESSLSLAQKIPNQYPVRIQF